MIARVAAARALQAAPSAALPAARGFHASAAQAATLRELEQRIKSVSNIEKITKSMKMIASTQLNKAQRAMDAAKKYGEANQEIFKQTGAKAPTGGKQLIVVVSSDKGLCGGIHSAVTKKTRSEYAAAPEGDKPQLIVVGDKSKSQLHRALPGALVLSFSGFGKENATFADAAAITDLIFAQGLEFDSIKIVYNKYVSAISFESVADDVYAEKILAEAPEFNVYEAEEGFVQDLAQFSIANAVFAALAEGHASEINSKRNAMDNASKNAGDMITNLNMAYNRGRQAAITNELVEIITGASAME